MNARHRGRCNVDEYAAKQILSAYGVAVPRSIYVEGSDQLGQALDGITPPFVLKIVSPDILHKSDSGGVRLGLMDSDAIYVAMRQMANSASREGYRVDGFLIEETARTGHDMVVGGVRDPGFGPVLMLGLGGIFVEVLRDVAFRICPISRLDAREMVQELKGAPILAGARGNIAISEDSLIDSLMAIGGKDGLLLDLSDELAEVDINPLIVSDTGAVAVDARFILTSNSDEF